MDFKKKSGPTLVELNDSAAARIVFCVHPAGGGVGYYEGLAKALAPYAKLYALEDPFIYADYVYGSLPELAEYHVDVIRSVQAGGPYTLFGYCSGGVIAYEIACQLELSGAAVDRVAMFGSKLVNGFDPGERERVSFLRDYLAARYGIQLAHLDWAQLETATFKEAAAAIVDDLRRQGVGDAHGDLDWAAKCIEAMCLMRHAGKKYRAPASQLDIDLYLWEYLDPTAAHKIRPWCNWETLTRGKLTIVAPPPRIGADVDIMFPPYLDGTVERVKKITLGLAEAASEHASAAALADS